MNRKGREIARGRNARDEVSMVSAVLLRNKVRSRSNSNEQRLVRDGSAGPTKLAVDSRVLKRPY